MKCANCGKPIERDDYRYRYCSAECRIKAMRHKHRQDNRRWYEKKYYDIKWRRIQREMST